MKAFTMTRLVAGLLLGSRAAVAHYTHRGESTIRRYCQPIACDIETRAALYDLDEAADTLARIRRVA